MIRLALVEYFNTRPFMDGLEAAFSPAELQLNLLPPAACAQALREGSCDMALLPVGSLLDFTDLVLLKDYCIGANGPVDSVFLLSQRPATELNSILLDPHSRSSNGLTRVLMAHYWQRTVAWIPTVTRQPERIRGDVGGVLIGDLAYKLRGQYAYAYDLSGVWKEFTGLPFVFAVWACRPGSIPAGDLARIRTALGAGMAQAADSAVKWGAHYGYSPQQAHEYLVHSLDFRFDAAKHEAVERYTRLLAQLPELSPQS